MKFRFFLVSILTIVGLESFAQIVNYSDFAQMVGQSQPIGSSRFLGLGGTHAALGGDLSNIASNPAGLGFYSRSEIGLGLEMRANNADAKYIDQSILDQTNRQGISYFGIVFGGKELVNNIRSTIGISYSIPRRFGLNFSLDAVNNASSLLDKFAEKANQNGETGESLNAQYDPNTNTANTFEGVAYQAYLLNPDENSDGAPFWHWEEGKPARQRAYIQNSGQISQWSFSYGLNYLDKIYAGFGMNFLRLDAKNQIQWQEGYPSGRNVSGFTLEEYLRTRGSGVNFQGGLIVRPNANFQLGVNIQSPTFYSDLYEEYTGGIDPTILSIPVIDNQGNENEIIQVNPIYLPNNQFYYSIYTPTKIDLGAVIFLKKKGFISANYGIQNFGKTRLETNYLNSGIDNSNFKNYQNGITQDTYQNLISYRFGAEYKITPRIALRGGYSYAGNVVNPNFDQIDRSISQFSGGLGYRSSKFYIDATYLVNQTNMVYTPYTLEDPSRYASAEINLSNAVFQISIGTFFN